MILGAPSEMLSNQVYFYILADHWLYRYSYLISISNKHCNYICVLVDDTILLEVGRLYFCEHICFLLCIILCDFAARCTRGLCQKHI